MTLYQPLTRRYGSGFDVPLRSLWDLVERLRQPEPRTCRWRPRVTHKSQRKPCRTGITGEVASHGHGGVVTSTAVAGLTFAISFRGASMTGGGLVTESDSGTQVADVRPPSSGELPLPRRPNIQKWPVVLVSRVREAQSRTGSHPEVLELPDPSDVG